MNPVTYAEVTLGIHSVYEEAEEIAKTLDNLHSKLSDVIIRRRTLNELIADREMEILIEERVKHKDHSEAALQRHVKEVIYKDSELRTNRSFVNACNDEITDIESSIERHKYVLKNKQVRMAELGGYMNFLAAAKYSVVSKNANTANEATR